MNYATVATPAEILLVEDNEHYVHLTQRAFEKAKVTANLHHVDNGKKCLEFLRREPPYSTVPVPDVILLDLDMPVMDGRQVLEEIVRDDALKHLAVVVLTAQDKYTEVMRMYQLRCSSYICKPDEFDEYVEMIRKFADYWLSVVMLPTSSVPVTTIVLPESGPAVPAVTGHFFGAVMSTPASRKPANGLLAMLAVKKAINALGDHRPDVLDVRQILFRRRQQVVHRAEMLGHASWPRGRRRGECDSALSSRARPRDLLPAMFASSFWADFLPIRSSPVSCSSVKSYRSPKSCTSPLSTSW